jgi:hypothetical protein
MTNHRTFAFVNARRRSQSRTRAGTAAMMTYQRLGSYVTAEPFRPFRISMASGQALEIRHPEMISVGRTSAHIDFILSDEPTPPVERVREISLMSIESVELIDAPFAQDKK